MATSTRRGARSGRRGPDAPPVLVEVTRGDRVESVHRGSVVLAGRFDEYGLGPEALAIMAASHSGEDRHVRLVQEILRRAGLTSSVLQNQVHPPFDAETAQRLVRDGEQPT